MRLRWGKRIPEETDDVNKLRIAKRCHFWTHLLRIIRNFCYWGDPTKPERNPPKGVESIPYNKLRNSSA